MMMSTFHLSRNQQHFLYLCAGTLLSFLLSSLLLKFITQSKLETRTVVQYYMPAEKACRETRHLVFVKVPKTGSTTLQNIIFRFGLSRDLNFMLPKTNNWLSKGRTIDPDSLFPIKKGLSYDILCNHLRYNKTDLAMFIHNDSTRIAILREPGSHLKSYLYYYHDAYLKLYPSSETDIVKKYLKQPEVHAKTIMSNPMSEWFGVVPKNATNKSTESFRETLFQLDQDFKVVLILEKMDESLVLMKRMLCWNLEDIVYIPRNTNQMYPRGNLTAGDKIRHEHISRVDNNLYLYFLEKLNSVIRQSGEDFQDEVRFFKKTLASVQTFCDNWRRKLGTALHIDASPWSPGFSVSPMSCLLLTYSEMELQNYVGLWQYGNVWETIHRDT